VEYKIHQIFPGGIYLYWIIHQGGETRQKGEEIRRHVCVGDKFIRFNINLYTSLKNKVAYLFNVVILLFPCALCRRHRRFFFLSHPARFEILVTKRGPAAAAEDREKNIIYNIWTACNKNGQQPHTLMTVPFWFFRLARRDKWRLLLCRKTRSCVGVVICNSFQRGRVIFWIIYFDMSAEWNEKN
jgi:hypothetical protein